MTSRPGSKSCCRTTTCGTSWEKQASGVPQASPGNAPPPRPSTSCAGSARRINQMPDRVLVRALMTGRARDYLHLAGPLLRSLDLTHHFELDVVTDPAALTFAGAEVILAASEEGLEPSQAGELTGFVKRGGGLVLLGGTLAAWNTHAALAALPRCTPTR